jgi:quinol monooxygenase YgiN
MAVAGIDVGPQSTKVVAVTGGKLDFGTWEQIFYGEFDGRRCKRVLVEHCRYDPGCLSCYIYENHQEKNVLMLEEVWRSEEDLDLHLRSEEYRNLLLVLEMGAKQPEIRFDTISSSTGIETIEKARSKAI